LFFERRDHVRPFLTEREAAAQFVDFIATQQTLTALAHSRAAAFLSTSQSSEIS
jgi:hypothetical protein